MIEKRLRGYVREEKGEKWESGTRKELKKMFNEKYALSLRYGVSNVTS